MSKPDGVMLSMLGQLVAKQAVRDTRKLSEFIAFKEIPENAQRLRDIAEACGQPESTVARTIFRAGLLSFESAIESGVLR